MAKSVWKIINNDTGSESEYAVIDPEAGGKGPSGGGGGMIPPLWRPDVQRDVQIAKWGLAALLTLFGLFYWLAYLPDVKETQKDIAGINTNVALTANAVGGISNRLDRIENKIDANQPQGSPRTGEAGSVHRGTRSGAGG